jgi:hypothetical protein
MPTISELGKAAARAEREKAAIGPAMQVLSGLSRAGRGLAGLGGQAARVLPSSAKGRLAAGVGAAGGLHLGQDAARSYFTPEKNLQKYYDKNQLAGQAHAQQRAALKAPTDFHETNVGQLLGSSAPRLGVAKPTNPLLRFLARPVHETRMNMSGDPGAYRPGATNKNLTPLPDGNKTVTNPDGTVTTVGPVSQTQHTNRSLLAKWQAEMAAAQTGATTAKHRQQADAAQQTGEQQYGQARGDAAALYRQLGLDPASMPQTLQPDPNSGESREPGRRPAGTQETSPATPGMGSADEMQRRRNRMRDLSRTWNTY